MCKYTKQMLMSTNILTNTGGCIIYTEIEVKLGDKD